MSFQEHNETILVVDDTPSNIMLLYEHLSREGFDLLVAENWESCTEVLQYNKPDLILLDIMMPKVDGYEVCQRLKSNQETASIPIIFMTALTDTINKVRGFSMGAVDYITKPFHKEEVLARIKTHLALSKLQKTLQARNQELDAFAHTVAHDLKNPLSAFSGLLSLLKDEFVPDKIPSEKALRYLDLAHQSVARTFSIIDALLMLAGVSRQQALQVQPLKMQDIVQQAQERLAMQIEKTGATITFPKQWPVAQGYAPWVEEIWANYISNALKYGGTPPVLNLGATLQANGQVKFWIQDNGEGLSEEQQKVLFTPFTRLKTHRQEGHGLGLSIVERIAHHLNGSVGVESTVGQGSIFYFTLPVPVSSVMNSPPTQDAILRI